jgi:3-phosphoshikimate 1-carboxyvinyltransferase
MKLFCDITLPSSKSESNRALMIAAYGGFEPDFQNLSDSGDTMVLSEALRKAQSGELIIDIADCGTAARFMTTYLACLEGDWLLTGTERMKQRPMAPLVEALRRLGADIQYVEKEGCLPLRIHGKALSGGKTSVDMSQSSQFASSLVLAAPMFPKGLELELRGELNSLPYLDMTLALMRHFSAHAERHGKMVAVKPQPYQQQPFTIEPDWTAASYWYEMAAFSEECEIRLRSLSLSKGRPNYQGDAIIAEWMTQLGVGTFIDGDDIVLRKIPIEIQPLHFDFSQHPDLYPTMAATCAGLKLDAVFTGLDNLTLKESDRVEAMQQELAKLGEPEVHFCAHNDHRIAMALAPLSMLFGPVAFDHPEVVEKSYPHFWDDARFLTTL